jgi:3',5'-cyclic AMP phosphodiesterase CpdA
MIDRRKFLKLSALGGGAVFMSGLYGQALAATSEQVSGSTAYEDFYFVQLSDSHWGYSGPNNPDAANTLKKAVAAVNGLETKPDFIVFTGDLTHTTDDPKERRKRMAEFRDIVGALNVKTVHFMPGEHDASLDNGTAFKEYFGETHYTFDHKGVPPCRSFSRCRHPALRISVRQYHGMPQHPKRDWVSVKWMQSQQRCITSCGNLR